MRAIWAGRSVLVGGLSCFLIFSSSVPVFASSDEERFAEARAALDRFNDCRTALTLLGGVSDQLKKDPIWIYYAAKANSCAGNPGEALHLFEVYDRLVPNEPEIKQQIVELRLKGKSEWRTTFCMPAQKLVGDWVNNFKNLRTEKQSSVASDRDAGVSWDVWNSSIEFQRPFYRNGFFASPGDDILINDDSRKSFAQVNLFRGFTKVGAGGDIFNLLESELRACFSADYDLTSYDRMGKIQIRDEMRDLTGKIVRGVPRHAGIPTIYGAYGNYLDGQGMEIDVVQFFVGIWPELEREIVK